MQKIPFSILSFFLFFIGVVHAQYEIKLNLEVGQTYPLNQEVKSVVNQMVNGMPQDVETLVSMKTDYKVTGMNGKNYLIDITPTVMKTTTNMGGMNQVMDSDGPASNPMNAIMKNLTGKTMKMEITPYGDLVSFDSNGYIAGLMDGVDLPAMTKAQLKGQLASEYDDASLKDSYLGLLNIYPKNKVKKGESWTSDYTADVVVPFETKSTSTLTEVSEDSFILNIKADLNTNGDKAGETMGMKTVSNFTGSMNTTYTLDRKTGWISSMEMIQDLDGKMVMPVSEMMPQETTIKMKVKNISTVK